MEAYHLIPLYPMGDRALCEPNPMTDDSIFGTSCLSQDLLWEQWWSVDQLVPLGSSEDGSSTVNGVYAQTDPLLDGSVYRCDTSSTHHWNGAGPVTDYADPWSSSSSVTQYMAPSSDSEHIVSEELPPVQTRWNPPLTLQQPTRKRKRGSNGPPPRKSARRSLGDEDINPPKEKKPKHSTVRRQNSTNSNASHPTQQCDDHMKVVRERNRIAANKLRAKKSEEALRLKSSEQDVERIHSDLSTCVADLTLEVYELKMQLLQHSGCNCTLIQNYLAYESQRYVQALDEKMQQEASYQQPQQPVQRE